jgi:hypothetical protein
MTDIAPGGPSANLPKVADDRGEYARRLVAQRAPELDAADLAALARPDPDDTGIPPAIAEQILGVLGHLMDRMDALEGLAARLG